MLAGAADALPEIYTELEIMQLLLVEKTAGREDRRRQEGCQGIVEEYVDSVVVSVRIL